MPEVPEEPNPFAAPKSDVRGHSSRALPPLATLWQRLAGALTEFMLGLAATLVLYLITGDLGTYLDPDRSADMLSNPFEGISAAGVRGQMAITLVFVAAQLYLMFTSAQSIGKRIVGTRIHRVSGEPASGWRILGLRSILPFTLYFLPIIGPLVMLGGIGMIFGAERRCLHDRIADTIVLQA